MPFRALLCVALPGIVCSVYARVALPLRVYLGCSIRAHCMAQRGFVWLGFVRALYGMTVPHGVPSYGLVRYGTARQACSAGLDTVWCYFPSPGVVYRERETG